MHFEHYVRVKSRKRSTGDLLCPADHTPAAGSTMLCKIWRKADIPLITRPLLARHQPSGVRLVEHRTKAQMRGRKVAFLGLSFGRAVARNNSHGAQIGAALDYAARRLPGWQAKADQFRPLGSVAATFG